MKLKRVIILEYYEFYVFCLPLFLVTVAFSFVLIQTFNKAIHSEHHENM